MNETRLAKKNDLSVKVMTAFAVAKVLIMILNHKRQEGLGVFLVLFCLYAVGNVVFQIMNDRSELTKYTSMTLFCLLTSICGFNARSWIDAFPIVCVIRMCVIYMDNMHTLVTCGLAILGSMIWAIMEISEVGLVAALPWVEFFLFVTVLSYGIRTACDITLREQETDKQEIEYHVAYQE